MSDYVIHIKYGAKTHTLKATIEYESAQIMRIRVQGNQRSILLETNYPVAQLSKGKAIKWQIKEGRFDMNDSRTARMLMDIFAQLEYYLKGQDSDMSQQQYLARKW